MSDRTTEVRDGHPRGRAGRSVQRIVFARLADLDLNDAKTFIEQHVSGEVPAEGVDFVLSGGSATKLLDQPRADVWVRGVDSGVIVAGATAASVMTSVQLCRYNDPRVMHAGAGVVTGKAQFFARPDGYWYAEDNPWSDDEGFVLDIPANDATRTLYLGESDSADDIVALVNSGWFDDLSERSESDSHAAGSLTVGGAGTHLYLSAEQGDSDTLVDSVWAALNCHQNVLLDGVAGSGKTYLRESLEDLYGADRVAFTVFHPSTTYEDFVRGMRPNFASRGSEADGSADREFVVADGLFVEICERAWQSALNKEGDEGRGEPYLLFIDEINRANTARVLGDLLYAIEGSKRIDATADGAEHAVVGDSVPGAVKLQVSDDDHPPYLRVPSNLHILGTMNSTDRSVGTLDLALQRRFHRISAEPFSKDQLVNALVRKKGLRDDVREELEPVFQWYSQLNSRLNQRVGPDARIGHAYFFKDVPTSREGVDEYVNGVASEIVAQVAEIMRSFVVDKRTLDEIMMDLPYVVRMEGEGLGASPVVDLPRSAAVPSSDEWPCPSDEIRHELFSAMVNSGPDDILKIVFEVLGPGPVATFDESVDLPATGKDFARVGKRVRDLIVEASGRSREAAAGNEVRCYDALMWGVAIPPERQSYRTILRGKINSQLLGKRLDQLSSAAIAHIEAVRAVNDAGVGEGNAHSPERNPVSQQLRRRKNVLVEGVAGSGKSHLLKKLTEDYDGNVEFVVFHPSSTYEDFVRGVRPVTVDNGTGREFEIADGVFLEMCKKAWASAISEEPKEFLLFVDEINRANTARVLGDLLCVIEDSKRVDPSAEGTPEPESCLTSEPTQNSVRLLVSDDEHPAHLRVPSNLHILGTMNSTDRSVGTLDLALLRRFGRVFQAAMTTDELLGALENEEDREITEELIGLVEWYGGLNKRLRRLVGPDSQVGHSYFFGRPGFAPTTEAISEQIFAQLTEIARVFACEDKLVSLTPATGDDAHPFGWRLVIRGQRLGKMPVLETTPVPVSEYVGQPEDQDDEQ